MGGCLQEAWVGQVTSRGIVAVFAIIWGALIGTLLVAIPAAIVWGHHGPDWPLIPLGIVATLGAWVGYKIAGRLP